jgi:hypothetical protein
VKISNLTYSAFGFSILSFSYNEGVVNYPPNHSSFFAIRSFLFSIFAASSRIRRLARRSGSYSVVRFSLGNCFLTYLPTWRAACKLLTTCNNQLSSANTAKHNEWVSFHGFSYCIRDLNTSGRSLPSARTISIICLIPWPPLIPRPYAVRSTDRVGHAKVTYCVVHGCNFVK